MKIFLKMTDMILERNMEEKEIKKIKKQDVSRSVFGFVCAEEKGILNRI